MKCIFWVVVLLTYTVLLFHWFTKFNSFTEKIYYLKSNVEALKSTVFWNMTLCSMIEI
jgi:hypothetical protein